MVEIFSEKLWRRFAFDKVTEHLPRELVEPTSQDALSDQPEVDDNPDLTEYHGKITNHKLKVV